MASSTACNRVAGGAIFSGSHASTARASFSLSASNALRLFPDSIAATKPVRCSCGESNGVASPYRSLTAARRS